MPSAGIHSTRSANWNPGAAGWNPVQSGIDRTSSTVDTAVANHIAARPAFFGNRRSAAAAAVGKKMRTVSRWPPRKFVISERAQHEQHQGDDADEERQRIVPDVSRLDEPEQIARELHEKRAGVQDSVDDEDVHDLPEHPRERLEWSNEQRVVELVDPELVAHERIDARHGR